MTETLTESEITTLYEMKQREAFPRRKNVLGVLLASLFIVGTIVAYLAFWALLMHVFGFDRMPDDVITTAPNEIILEP